MRNKITTILDTIYASGMDWLRDAVYAVIVLLLAVTFPVWAVPCAIWKHLHG